MADKYVVAAHRGEELILHNGSKNWQSGGILYENIEEARRAAESLNQGHEECSMALGGWEVKKVDLKDI